MKSRTAAAALLTLSLLLPLTACSNGAPGPDSTGPVKATEAQSSPQDLVVEVLRLRDEGKPEQAARDFISRDIKQAELDTMTEVDASVLCTSNRTDCTEASDNYSRYLNGKDCSSTTAEQAKEAGVEVSSSGRIAEVLGTRTTGHSCMFGVRQIGSNWWIVGS